VKRETVRDLKSAKLDEAAGGTLTITQNNDTICVCGTLDATTRSMGGTCRLDCNTLLGGLPPNLPKTVKKP
jgi:hypothetical protein